MNGISLLRKAMKEYGCSIAPKKVERYGNWYEITIPIGKDNVAFITFDDDVLSEVKNTKGLTAKKFQREVS